MSRRTDLPIMIGKNLKKGIVAERSRYFSRGIDIFIVWLKKQFKTGETFQTEDIDKIDVQLHFCDRESVEQMVSVLTAVLADWELFNGNPSGSAQNGQEGSSGSLA